MTKSRWLRGTTSAAMALLGLLLLTFMIGRVMPLDRRAADRERDIIPQTDQRYDLP